MARDVNKSPFPGMDPYLEPLWSDAYCALPVYTADAMREFLPDKLIARTGASDFLNQYSKKSPVAARLRDLLPDILAEDRVTYGFVRLFHASDAERILTIVAFNSPRTRSAFEDRRLYRDIRDILIESGVNFVEVDLVRSGEWNLRAPLESVPDHARGTFNICVTRASRSNRIELYPCKLQDRLPTIRVPLNDAYDDIALDFQFLLEKVYEHGSYGRDIDYSKPPVPPLSDADQKWTSDWLATRLG